VHRNLFSNETLRRLRAAGSCTQPLACFYTPQPEVKAARKVEGGFRGNFSFLTPLALQS
jgi:hypothetical protein